MISTFLAAAILGYSVKQVILAAVIVALVIWLVFYVLPLPQMVRTILAVAIALILIFVFLPGCSYEKNADGSQRFSFSPTTADYKAVRNFTR